MLQRHHADVFANGKLRNINFLFTLNAICTHSGICITTLHIYWMSVEPINQYQEPILSLGETKVSLQFKRDNFNVISITTLDVICSIFCILCQILLSWRSKRESDGWTTQSTYEKCIEKFCGKPEPIWRQRHLGGKHWYIQETGIQDMDWYEFTQDGNCWGSFWKK